MQVLLCTAQAPVKIREKENGTKGLKLKYPVLKLGMKPVNQKNLDALEVGPQSCCSHDFKKKTSAQLLVTRDACQERGCEVLD